jgi:hypothetical protein
MIVCGRADDPTTLHQPGSALRPCARCGLDVRASLAAQHEQAARGTRLLCLPCWRTLRARGEVPREILFARQVADDN